MAMAMAMTFTPRNSGQDARIVCVYDSPALLEVLSYSVFLFGVCVMDILIFLILLGKAHWHSPPF